MTLPVRERPRHTPPPAPGGVSGRVRLDLARGVLMAWTGCTPDEAFTQLVDVAGLHSVTVFALADAVLTVTHPGPAPDTDADADPAVGPLLAVVHRCWPHAPDPGRAPP